MNGHQKYFSIPVSPVKGILYVTLHSPEYISGHIRVRGRENGSYPYNYLEMLERLFGKQDDTVEVCSGMIRKYGDKSCFTVDINPKTNPYMVDDGQVLSSVPNAKFNRRRCDPSYNADTDLQSPIKLLKAGARVCKVGSLMFLFLGPQTEH